MAAVGQLLGTMVQCFMTAQTIESALILTVRGNLCQWAQQFNKPPRLGSAYAGPHILNRGEVLCQKRQQKIQKVQAAKRLY